MTSGARLSLIVALVVGGLAAFLVHGVLANIMASSVRAGMSSTIVVARMAIPFGAPLTKENLKEVAWQSADPLQGSFATIGELNKDGRRLALLSLQRDEPILASRITGPNQRSALSTQLGENMRAVTVRVDEVRGVAGFILPGDRVDVISTRGEGGNQDSAAFADVLLQDVKVLAIDQLSDERQDKPTIARAVTLELTVEQAQKVVLAQGIGRLSLVLRQANDIGQTASSRVTVSDLGGAEQASRDRLGEVDKRLAELKSSTETALQNANAKTAEKLDEIEARLRDELAAKPGAEASPPTPSRQTAIVNVTRNAARSESYTVPSER